MLYLIGLGLSREGISLKGLKKARTCDTLYLENYTSVIPELDSKDLEEKFGRKIKVLNRSEVEKEPNRILGEAKEQDVGFLVMGDPLVATTHISLVLEARKRQVETEIVHASSIYSAISEIGLQIYKIGKSATIPMERDTKVPYETLRNNEKRGLHTLLFLDLNPKEGEYLGIPEAIGFLLSKTDGEDLEFKKDTKVIGAARIGSDSTIYYGKAEEIKKKDFGEPPYVLIVPGKLHFMEEEALKKYSINTYK